jgi:hypothetical protein
MTDFTTETETDFTRKNLPPLSDHAFWRNLRVQTNTTKPMSQIASELGVDLDDLCAWIMAYTEKTPKKQKEYVNRDSEPVNENSQYPASQSAQRFAAWRKAQEGAASTRRMLALSHSVGAE